MWNAIIGISWESEKQAHGIITYHITSDHPIRLKLLVGRVTT